MRRSLAAVTVVAAATSLTALTPFTPASAAACQTERNAVRGDVDGDGAADLVVGVPQRNRGRGVVDLRTTSAHSKLITRGGSLGADGDRFGSTIALADVNNDNCADMFIAAPGADGGTVFVVFGAPTGLREKGVLQIHPARVKGRDGFGKAIAVARRAGAPGYDLWISAPGDNVRGVKNAGSVRHYAVTPDGKSADVDFVETIHQDKPRTLGKAEENDFFGTSLAAARGAVLIGVPREDLGKKVDAGTAFYRHIFEDGGTVTVQQLLSQAGDRPGKPERGDRFGAAVALNPRRALIAAPGEDLGNKANAGWVQAYRRGGPLVPRRTLTQNTHGVPGRADAGDAFGASVLLGHGLVCPGQLGAAIGVPGEDVRSVPNAGAVALVPIRKPDTCVSYLVQQGDEVSGTPEEGDALGASLALQAGHNDQAFVGVPGEDLGGATNAGLVQLTPRAAAPNHVARIIINDEPKRSATFSAGPRDAFFYGFVLGSPPG